MESGKQLQNWEELHSVTAPDQYVLDQKKLYKQTKERHTNLMFQIRLRN
jgi:hypothetical protein